MRPFLDLDGLGCSFASGDHQSLRGRSRKGQRLRASAPFGHWKTQTFVAGLRCHELSAPWIIDGPITRSAFETYVETQLAPTLSKGDVVILDNLAAHKSEKAAQCLKQQRRLVPVPATLQSRSESDRDRTNVEPLNMRFH